MKHNQVILRVTIESDKGKRGSTRVVNYTTDLDGKPLTHQSASQMARNAFKGMRTKIIDKGQRMWNKSMKSYCDLMEQQGGF